MRVHPNRGYKQWWLYVNDLCQHIFEKKKKKLSYWRSYFTTEAHTIISTISVRLADNIEKKKSVVYLFIFLSFS